MHTDQTILTIHGITLPLADHEAAGTIVVRRTQDGAVQDYVTVAGGPSGGLGGAAPFQRPALNEDTQITLRGETLTIAQAEAAGLISVRRSGGEVVSYERLA